jgi:NAD(P)-dependent dehydrogenase (short-subunit alcohol dehydrogenase family)
VIKIAKKNLSTFEREMQDTTFREEFVAEPNDLDGMILYLASNKASRYVTGSCMTVDGGLSWGG